MPSPTKRPLSPGDPCYVRLHNGEIVGAEYCRRSFFNERSHIVFVGGRKLMAVKRIDHPECECRFTTGKPSEENARC